MNIEEFVILPIAVGVMICTEVIKRAFFHDEEMKDRWVPLVAIVLGVLFNTWYNQWTFDYIIFLNGLASGFAAIGTYSAAKSMFGAGKVEEEVEEEVIDE